MLENHKKYGCLRSLLTIPLPPALSKPCVIIISVSHSSRPHEKFRAISPNDSRMPSAPIPIPMVTQHKARKMNRDFSPVSFALFRMRGVEGARTVFIWPVPFPHRFNEQDARGEICQHMNNNGNVRRESRENYY